MTRTAFVALLMSVLVVALAASGWAQISDSTVRIAVMNDMSGPFSEVTGKGGLVAAQMAAEDFGGTVRGARIEVIGGDHQNKPDIASVLARSWYEQNAVDAIVEVPVSSAAIAVQAVAAKMGKAFLITGGSISDFTGRFCSTTSVHWADDSRALAQGNARAVVESGGKTWFFITSDFVFGRTLEAQASEVVAAAGGQVLGSVRHPLGATDFSSLLLRAQAESGAGDWPHERCDRNRQHYQAGWRIRRDQRRRAPRSIPALRQ